MYSFISVVVPAYNGEKLIGRCIESLLAMDYPKDRMEILIVDNHSTDQTPRIISEYPVIGLREERPGSNAARNKAVTSARGEIIAFTDVDCEVDASWAREIDSVFQDGRVDAVMGFSEGINENFWAHLEQGNFEEFWFRRDSQGYSLKRLGVDTRNCAVRKAVLEECGYLNADLPYCGDLDLSVKMRARQCHLVFNENMRVWHHNRTVLGQILEIKEKHALAFFQIVEQQPDGFDCPDLPCDFSTFLGVDNRSTHGFKLKSVLVGLKVLRPLISLGLRGLSFVMAKPNGLAVKIFKTLCGISWEITILEAKRQREQRVAGDKGSQLCNGS